MTSVRETSVTASESIARFSTYSGCLASIRSEVDVVRADDRPDSAFMEFTENQIVNVTLGSEEREHRELLLG